MDYNTQFWAIGKSLALWHNLCTFCNVCLVLNSGGGITERNLQRILEGSRAQEFHCSARTGRDSAMKFRWVSTWILIWATEKESPASTRNQLIYWCYFCQREADPRMRACDTQLNGPVSNPRLHRLPQILEQDALITHDLLLYDLHLYRTDSVISHTGIAR